MNKRRKRRRQKRIISIITIVVALILVAIAVVYFKINKDEGVLCFSSIASSIFANIIENSFLLPSPLKRRCRTTFRTYRT